MLPRKRDQNIFWLFFPDHLSFLWYLLQSTVSGASTVKSHFSLNSNCPQGIAAARTHACIHACTRTHKLTHTHTHILWCLYPTWGKTWRTLGYEDSHQRMILCKAEDIHVDLWHWCKHQGVGTCNSNPSAMEVESGENLGLARKLVLLGLWAMRSERDTVSKQKVESCRERHMDSYTNTPTCIQHTVCWRWTSNVGWHLTWQNDIMIKIIICESCPSLFKLSFTVVTSVWFLLLNPFWAPFSHQ